MQTKVAPSMLAAHPLHLLRDAKAAEQAGVELLHVDVMDGHFVPNLAFAPATVAALYAATPVPCDVHLMMTNPENYFETFIKSGAAFLSFHIEAAGERAGEWLEAIRALGAKAGLVLSPPTPVEAVLPWLEACDFILVMGVNPGFGGQKMDTHVYSRIAAIRAHAPNLPIEVDGGVTPENAQGLREAGANWLVSGTAFWRAEDLRAAADALRGAGT